MKKALYFIFILSLFTSLISCEKQGPMGPPGPQGPQGPEGPAGGSNVFIYNFTLPFSEFYYNEQNAEYEYIFTVEDVPIYATDAVLLYVYHETLDGVEYWAALPANLYFIDYPGYVNYSYELGDDGSIRLRIRDSEGNRIIFNDQQNLILDFQMFIIAGDSGE